MAATRNEWFKNIPAILLKPSDLAEMAKQSPDLRDFLYTYWDTHDKSEYVTRKDDDLFTMLIPIYQDLLALKITVQNEKTKDPHWNDFLKSCALCALSRAIAIENTSQLSAYFEKNNELKDLVANMPIFTGYYGNPIHLALARKANPPNTNLIENIKKCQELGMNINATFNHYHQNLSSNVFHMLIFNQDDTDEWAAVITALLGLTDEKLLLKQNSIRKTPYELAIHNGKPKLAAVLKKAEEQARKRNPEVGLLGEIWGFISSFYSTDTKNKKV